MTVATKHFSYQRSAKPLFNSASPNLMVLKGFLQSKYGGQNLGCYGVRAIRGGKVLSTHASGAAWDWRYMNPGPGRATLLNEILPFLIDHSAELGIQAIHDYLGCRIWQAGRGWMLQQRDAYGMGSGQWIHVEVHPDNWADNRTVEQKLGLGTGPMPIFDPAHGQFGLYPFAAKATISMALGSRGDLVKYHQGCLVKAGFFVSCDGQFGPLTDHATRDYQAHFKLHVDGEVGPQTWRQDDKVAVA